MVAHVRFGPRPGQLGLYSDRQHTSTPIYPPSFAIDQDRTIWFLDIVKHRIAHFSARGRFLGQVQGVRFSRHSPLPVDIAFGGDTLYLLSHRTPLRGVVQSVSDAGVQAPETVRTRGNQPAIVNSLYPSSGPGPLGQVGGRASRDWTLFGTGRSGVADLLGPSDEVRFLPGYPLESGSFMSLTGVPTSDQDLELRYASGPIRSTRPIHIRLITARGERSVPAIIQFEQDTGTPHGIVASVGVGPARASDSRLGDGRWLLGVFDDGSAMICDMGG